jgi:hypothetical protein
MYVSDANFRPPSTEKGVPDLISSLVQLGILSIFHPPPPIHNGLGENDVQSSVPPTVHVSLWGS